MSDDRKQTAMMLPLDRAPFTARTLDAIAFTDFVPSALRGKPKAILAAILTGRELGLGPMEALRSIDVIDGRPSPSPEWMLGRILEAGHTIKVIEQTDEACEVEGQRYRDGQPHGDPMRFRFTMDMARRVETKVKGKKATLADKTNYRHYPEAMLYWRAVAQLARQYFPDCTRGIKHTPDELGAEDWQVHGYLPEEREPEAEETTTIVDHETGEILDETDADTDEDEDVAEAQIEEPELPEPTGKADGEALDRVRVGAEDGNLWNDLIDTLGTLDDWIEKRVDDIDAQLRFVFRAMEFLGIWQGTNVLREELRRVGVNHLSEFNKSALQKFTKNMVIKAQVATKKEGNDAG